jgi:hypothetical protein
VAWVHLAIRNHHHTLFALAFYPPHLNTIPHSQYLILRPNSHGQLVYHYTEDCKGDGKQKENECKRADERLSFSRENNALVEGYHDIYRNQSRTGLES